jgi:hypothetical protein
VYTVSPRLVFAPLGFLVNETIIARLHLRNWREESVPKVITNQRVEKKLQAEGVLCRS